MELHRPIDKLELGFNDAINYRRRENKGIFDRLFIKNRHLDELMKLSTYFLIGDKGTGKTAYAVWLDNNLYKNTSSSNKYIVETDYQKFVTLKKEKHLALSDYTNIWKVILLLLMSKHIYETDGDKGIFNKYVKYKNLNDAIDKYYEGAFSPEILYAMDFVENSSISAKILSDYSNIGTSSETNRKFSENKFQTNLFYIQRQFEASLSSLKLSKNYTLFIDGIDLRPTGIDYTDYLDCVKGLANAVWQLNNDFFSTIRDSKGRLKVTMLLRADIFNAIGLQNSNNKIRDNSVMLDWRGPYKLFKQSELYKLSNRILSIGQIDQIEKRKLWDHYFPYTVEVRGRREREHSFISFLRFSYFRPRDIVTMLNIIRDIHLESGSDRNYFIEEDFRNPQFRRRYSEYLLGEVKDYLAFYYTDKEYELFLKFFEFARGSYSFTYDEYEIFYTKFIEFINEINEEIPKFANSANDFLQFLYELNIIFCVEETSDGKKYLFWCFKDRNVSNISPRVKTHCRYEIFYGLGKSLNMGKQFVES